MIKKNYSEKGWRLYIIPNFLRVGQRRMELMQVYHNIEFLIEGDLVYVRDKFKHDD